MILQIEGPKVDGEGAGFVGITIPIEVTGVGSRAVEEVEISMVGAAEGGKKAS